MSDRREPREDAEDRIPAPEATSTQAASKNGLSPGLWVPGLIALVLLLLAVFALV